MNAIIENIKIENMIYEIRGKQVMLDNNLAILYQYYNGTKIINQAAKRRIKRFMFQLNNKEYKIAAQIGTTII